jgi:hypothetical protein
MEPAAAVPADAPEPQTLTPTLSHFGKHKGVVTFTLAGVHVSIANGLRRTILGRLPSLGIVPFPEADTTVTIATNTSPLHNELVKSRLACIAFHLDPDDPLAKRLEVRLRQQNTGDSVQLVTVGDIELWDSETETKLSEESTRAILPPDPATGDHALLLVLHPPIGTMPGAIIDLRATLERVTPHRRGTYALASTCAYKYTPDVASREAAWAAEELPNDVRTRAIWDETTAGQHIVPDSYDFVLRAVGWMNERELLTQGLIYMRQALTEIGEKGDAGGLNVTKVKDVLAPHTFDVEIAGDTYALGHCIRHQLYVDACGPGGVLASVGFDKLHAHDPNGVLRMVFRNDASAVNASHLTARAAHSVAAVYDALVRRVTRSEAKK